MATIRELAASFVANPSGMRSALQAIKKDVNELQSASSKASGKMSGDFAKSASNIGKSTSGIAKHFHNMSVGVQKSFESIGKSMTDAGKTLEGWGTSIQKTGKTATKVLSPLTAFYATAAVTGGSRMIANEQLDILMKNVFRTEEAYQGAWKAVEGLTKGTAFMNSDVGGWLSQLVQSNVELDKSEDIMKSILDFSVGSGQLGIEGEIHDIIMKAVRSGGWDQMTLDMMAQRGLNLAGHVANVLGIETTAAQDMLKDGTISMEESLDYFVDAVQVGSEGAGGYFAKMADSAQQGGETMAGAWINVKAAVAQLGQDMWESGAWDQLKTALNNITDFLYQISPALEPIAKVIASILATMVEWVQKLMNAFINLSPKMQSIIAGLSVIGAVLGPAIFMFGAFVGAVGKAMKPFGALFTKLSDVLKVLNGKNGLKGVLEAIGKRFTFLTGPIGIAIGLFATLYSTSQTFRKAFHAVIGSIIDFGKKIYDLMKPAIDTVIESFKIMMDSFKGAGGGLDSLGASFSPLLSIIGALVKAIMGGLAVAFGLIMPLISGVARAIGPLIKTISSLISIVVNLGMAILSVFVLDFSKSMEHFKAAFQSAIDFFINLWGVFEGFFSGFISTLIAEGSMLFGSWSKLGDMADWVWNGIITLIDKVKGAFVGLAESLNGDSIKAFFVAIATWFENGFESIAESIKGLGHSVSDWFVNSFVEGINEKLSSIKEFGNKIVNSLSDGIKQGAQNISSSLSGLGESISDAISVGLNSKAGDLVKGYFESVKQSLQSFGGIATMIAPSLVGIGSRMLGLTGPIGLVVSIVTSLISTLVRLYNTNEDVRNFIQNAWQGIQSTLSSVWSALSPIFDEFIKIFGEIAKELGPEFAETKKVIVDSFNELKPAFKELGETFAELGTAFSDIFKEIAQVAGEVVRTVIPIWLELQSMFVSSIGEIVKIAIPSLLQGFKSIFPLILDVIKSVIGIAVEIFTMLIDVISDIAKTVLPLLLSIVQSVFPVILNVIKTVLPLVMQVFMAFIDVVLELAKTILPMILSVVRSVLPMVLNIVKAVLPMVISIFTMLIDVVMSLVKTVLPLILSVVKSVFPMVLSIIKAVLPIVVNLIESVVNVILTLAKAVIPLVLKVIQAAFPIIQKIIEVAMKVAVTALKLLVGVIQNVVVPAIEFILKVVQTVFPVITKVIEGALNIVIGILDFFVALFTGNWSGMWDAVKKILDSATSIIWSIVKGVFDLIALFIKTTFDAIASFFSWIWSKITDVFKTVISTIYNFVKDRFTATKNTVTTIFTAVWNFLKSTWDKISNVFSTVIKWIVDFVKTRFNNLKTNVTNIFNGIKSMAKKVWNGIKDNIVNPVKDGVNWAIDKFKGFKDSVTETFKNIKDNVFGYVSDMIQKIKDMPGKMKDKLKKNAGKLFDGMKDVGQKMVDGIAKGVNGVIAGVNWVLDKFGVDTSGDDNGDGITYWTPKLYAKGTRGAHPEDSPAIVGDGKGSNSGPELMRDPKGNFSLSPAKPTLIPNMPKGTQVWSATDTRSILDPPQYAWGKNWGISFKDVAKALNLSGKALGYSDSKKEQTIGKVASGVGTAFDVYNETPKALLNAGLKAMGVEVPNFPAAIGDMAKSGFKYVKGKAVDFIKGKQEEELESAAGPTSGGAKAWRSTIKKAAARMQESATNAQINGIIAQINRESGGNQKIVQSSAVVDVNTLAGNPARGLLQYIPQSFAAYKMPGHGNIYSGYDQLLAFFNNKNWRRDLPYGRRGWGPTGARKYADGGIVNTKQLAWIADGGWAESIISHDPAKHNSQRAIWEKTGNALGFTDDKYSERMLAELERIASVIESGDAHIVNAIEQKPVISEGDIQRGYDKMDAKRSSNHAIFTGRPGGA